MVRRIAFVFDFDKTLAEDSFPALLRWCKFNPEAFEAAHVQPLVEAGWEKMLARSFALVQASRHGPIRITRDLLAEVGRNIQLFEEVEEVFPHLRGVVDRVTPGVEVEFYILTSGFVEIPRATPIAKEFKGIFGGEFHFDDAGELSYIRKTVPHAEKVNYLLILSKGLEEANNNPAHAYRKVLKPSCTCLCPKSSMLGTAPVTYRRLIS